MSVVALNTYLDPLKIILDDVTVNELIINRPGEIWVERKGVFSKEERPDLTLAHLRTLAELVAQSTNQFINEEHPLLAATLPAGYRVQCVIAPACPKDNIVIAIRRQTMANMTLDDYNKAGAFDHLKASASTSPVHNQLREHYKAGDYFSFLKCAIKNKITFIISGGTSTGKTTFLNACLKEIPANERLVTIEDAREVFPPHTNAAHLIYSKGDQGLAKVNAQQLLEASLRLRPDRIILGELRGAEAYTFLRAINTGHEGSISSIHADTPALAYDQIALMVMQAGLGLDRAEIVKYVRGIIPIVVQLRRASDGRRYISEIHYDRLEH